MKAYYKDNTHDYAVISNQFGFSPVKVKRGEIMHGGTVENLRGYMDSRDDALAWLDDYAGKNGLVRVEDKPE
ncbi:MAG: hypothetical protein LBD12_00945 [Clostridiales Family XIII bacterium]|nr:hypothetical protein [Clostridiales Family XIII bacterium]